jgi:hypothetical protein
MGERRASRAAARGALALEGEPHAASIARALL